MLEQYFIENDKKKLISECKSTTEMGFDLTQSQKVECVNTVADYGIKVFGLNPLPHQYKMLALAAIGFIHGLISTTGDATVCTKFLFQIMDSQWLVQIFSTKNLEHSFFKDINYNHESLCIFIYTQKTLKLRFHYHTHIQIFV